MGPRDLWTWLLTKGVPRGEALRLVLRWECLVWRETWRRAFSIS